MKYLAAALTALLLFVANAAVAALPPARFIATQLVKNAGAGVYQIEQDVQFVTSGEPLILRETWWIENENTMRLQVTGLRELKNQFNMVFVYRDGQRVGNWAQGKMAKKLNEDFIEKYFHYRSAERLIDDLAMMRVLPASAYARKGFRTIKDVDYRPEPQVRLGRSGGGIAYVFGTPSPAEGAPLPGFWIEQDAFVLRKFRLPSTVEVVADRFFQSARGLQFPRARTVRWGTNSVQIQTVNVSSKTGLKGDFFSPSGLDAVNKAEGIQNAPLKALVEEFYSRFR